MSFRGLGTSVAALAALILSAHAAHAQKSKDTLRFATDRPITIIDEYLDLLPELSFLSEAVYDTLIIEDEANKSFAPLLAKSWTRIDERTLELQLRDDVVWQDGEKFDADDVVYTYGYLIDPKVNLRLKPAWAWIEKVEKTGPHTVRIVAQRPTPYDLARIARTQIYPQHVHGPLADKREFGLKPIGTGPYRVLQVDKNKGLIAERTKTYNLGGAGKPAPTIGRFEFRPVPDASTQVAEFVTGNLDIMRADSPDQARDLAQKPGVVRTVRNVASIIYVLMDMKGRSGNKALSDPRVREAIIKAIDKRPFPILVGSDGSNVGFPEALCNRVHFGCDYSRPLPEFDLAGAKKLMAEAGYAQGFNLTITAVESPMIEIAQVIGSQLKSIGITASIGRDTFNSYRDKQRDGKIEFLVQTYGGSGLSDVSQILEFYFSPGPRDFHGRTDWNAAVDTANGEMNEAKRKAIVRELMDQVTDSRYMIPVSPYPKIWIHTKDVAVKETGRFFFGYGITMSEISWK